MKQWFAVQSRPRQEQLAEENLLRQGLEAYCPRIRRERRSAGRWRVIVEPLFSRNPFVYLTPGVENFTPVRSNRGARDFVRFGGIPGRVPGELVDEIRASADPASSLHLDNPAFRRGDALELTSGPFAGCREVFQAITGVERVVILLSLLGRVYRVEVARNAVTPA